MKRLTFVLIAAFTISLSVPVSASAQDTYVPEDLIWPADHVMFSIADEGTTFMTNTILITTKVGTGKDTGQKSCDDFDDADCRFNGKFDYIGGNSVLPPCEADASVNCIEKVEISVGEAPMESALYRESIGGINIPPKPSVGYPGGSTISLWSAANSPASNGVTDYAVAVMVKGDLEVGKQTSWVMSEFYANVTPFRILTGDRYKVPFQESIQRQDGSWGTGLGGHSLECVWSDLGRCGRGQNFADETKIRLTLRLPKEIGGWFKGRMKDPVISISSFSSSHNRFVIQAEPVQVQKFATSVNRNEFTSQEAALFKSNGNGGMKGGIGSWQTSSRPSVFEYINYFKSKVDDSAAGVNRVWSMGSVNTGGGSGCFSDGDKVMGIVTTNALGYDGSSPSFSGGFLNYKVAGLHYMPDKQTEFLGTYDLVMRSEVARCLYKFNKAPVSATITVSGGDTNTVATTVVSEKNGWLKLAAYGFTFSNKNIKVKLTQKKSTITCVNIQNQKLVKKLTNYSPTCPTGFRKK